MTQLDIRNTIDHVVKSMPKDWLRLTTHRLDTYNESLAKVEFLERFEEMVTNPSLELLDELKELPTAFDYIRLGHPLSCVFEWLVAKQKNINANNIISFSSHVMPILAVLRHNLFLNKKTYIIYEGDAPKFWNGSNLAVLKDIYQYQFELLKLSEYKKQKHIGSSVRINKFSEAVLSEMVSEFDFNVYCDDTLGSIIQVNGLSPETYIDEIQHVRRRESIAMTPRTCLEILESFSKDMPIQVKKAIHDSGELKNEIKKITDGAPSICLGSSGLSIQYAIMMGLVEFAENKYRGQKIKFIVPPNCYGGTNDQARRVAACIQNVEVIDLFVDSGNDMVQSLDEILNQVANDNEVPFIIAEIPTNPRVEVPDLNKLREVLKIQRKTKDGVLAAGAVFILDQTFCPNIKFLGQGDFLGDVSTISYVSGSKFPSGGVCTAGYCIANNSANHLMKLVEKHLVLCGNQATDFQVQTLTTQIPSMNQRINDAYNNTRSFVDFIEKILPQAKINFVSEDLALNGFTPSVFSLDLPTKGNNHEERESHKRDLNLKLINMMINEIPHESKYCVSYGQLKGCYWTIPATSTQGTTQEGHKDYIVRVSISPDFDIELHKKVFQRFCDKYID